MPDTRRPEAERAVQQIFRISSVFNALLFVLAVVFAHRWLSGQPDREPQAEARAAVRFEPAELDGEAFAPLRLAGAWRVNSPEPRMGGVSALALVGDGFLALTDSGVLIQLPRPGVGQTAQFRDLPDGPGGGFFKAGRDSEALARDAGGRGWWVTFETAHSAWLYDDSFRRVIRTIDLGAMGWRPNKGAEGAVSTRDALIVVPETGDEVVRIGVRKIERQPLANPYRLSDATLLPDGRMLLLARTFGPAGFAARLLLLDQGKVKSVARLALGRLDNAEAIAAEPLPGGGVRLWVMTDNDFRRRVPTLLVALDWAG